MDFLHNPAGRPGWEAFDIARLAPEARDYLAKTGAMQATPIEAVPRPAEPAQEPGTRFVGSAPAGLVGLFVATGGVDRGKEFRIDGDVEIGREVGCRVKLSDPETSRRHAKIKIENGAPHLYDLASTNGTFVNGQRITDAVLGDNDVVRIGNTEMAVKLLTPAQAAKPAKGGTMMKPAAKSATVLKAPPSWTARIDAGPDAGRTFSLGRPVVVGREGDEVLGDEMVSRKHARIEVKDGAVFVEDLESSNGTEILRPDGVAVKVRPGRPQPLAEGEKVRVGDTELSFTPPGDA